MTVTKDEVKHLGWLSRIELSDNEIETYSAQIEQVLHYLDILDSVPVSQQHDIAIKKKVVDLREDKVTEFGADPLGTVYRKDGYVKGPRMVS